MIIKDIIKSIKGKQIVEENKKRTKKGVKSRTKNPKITKTNSENKKILNYMTHSKRSKKIIKKLFIIILIQKIKSIILK